MKVKIERSYRNGPYRGYVYDEEMNCWKMETKPCWTKAKCMKELIKYKEEKEDSPIYEI